MLDIIDLTPDTLAAYPDYDRHERVICVKDSLAGLTAYIGVHNTALGPGLGGCRIAPYASEEEAITDVLRLSRAMTYKSALAGMPLGGGKSVIVGNPANKTVGQLRSFGQAIAELNGLYITAEDSGTTEEDMSHIAQETMHVTGIPGREGELGGDPSPMTARGLLSSIRTALMKKTGDAHYLTSLNGVRVAVQGLGAVGMQLCRLLHAEGVQLTVTDIDPERLGEAQDKLGARVVAPDEIFDVEADVFSPCALGGQLNDNTIPRLKVQAVAGGANNQLSTAAHAAKLHERGIVYAPDFVINSGGVISVGYEYFFRMGEEPFGEPVSLASMHSHVDRIGDIFGAVYDESTSRGISQAEAADSMAEAVFKGGAPPVYGQIRQSSGG